MRGAAMEILHSAGAGGGRVVESVILMAAIGQEQIFKKTMADPVSKCRT
jgi:hypothetical protein